MKKAFFAIFLTVLTVSCSQTGQNKESDITQYEYTTPHDLFEKGNYAMLICMGPYSRNGGVWKGKTYYGISEWLIHMADIPAQEYIDAAREFNPTDWDAQKIVDLAKAAGMKYIVITSKHCDGFAMYHSECNPFNIVDHTKFGRDPIKELADCCHANGIGLGLYYSHCIDWTSPGGGYTKANGTETVVDHTMDNVPPFALGNTDESKNADFRAYFRNKVIPQVNEITTKYGDLVTVWFDCPSIITEEETKELYDLVHKNQPNALVSGRIGLGYGDFETIDDMDMFPENQEGMWECIDTSNDSWGYAEADKNWKSPKEMLVRMFSIIARGGTYVLNVGPDGKGMVPELCVQAISEAGTWIHRYPQVVYDVQASPWNQQLPWGDAVRHGNKIYLLVYDWPAERQLDLYGLTTGIKSARLLDGNKSSSVKFSTKGDWTEIYLPADAPERWINVVELTMESEDIQLVEAIPLSKTAGYDHISGMLAKGEGCEVETQSFAAKFGEWYTERVVKNLGAGGKMTWTFAVKDPGYYNVKIRVKGEDEQAIFHVTTDEGSHAENSRIAAKTYEYRSIGWIKFEKPGIHTVSVSMPEGGNASTEVAGISLKYVDL